MKMKTPEKKKKDILYKIWNITKKTFHLQTQGLFGEKPFMYLYQKEKKWNR